MMTMTDNDRLIDLTLASLDEPDRFPADQNIWIGSRRLAAKGFDTELPDHEGEPEV
jgi:hypothetical protein